MKDDTRYEREKQPINSGLGYGLCGLYSGCR